MISIPESHTDLLSSNVCTLATIGPDGFPQVTATWFLYDDDGMVRISLNTSRQKARNLQDRPQCTFFILDPANPLRTIEIRARAEVTPDDDYLFATKFGAKYGMDVRLMDQPGQSRLVVTLHPVKVNAIDMSRG